MEDPIDRALLSLRIVLSHSSTCYVTSHPVTHFEQSNPRIYTILTDVVIQILVTRPRMRILTEQLLLNAIYTNSLLCSLIECRLMSAVVSQFMRSIKSSIFMPSILAFPLIRFAIAPLAKRVLTNPFVLLFASNPLMHVIAHKAARNTSIRTLVFYLLLYIVALSVIQGIEVHPLMRVFMADPVVRVMTASPELNAVVHILLRAIIQKLSISY
ncbi:hypothetical protein HNY73_014117 [Argiope bruennichi]|uniref:Uncharacterized protein n=1 Tax=Argiope bruennichi TaxID=94029 RepID=A0A8T0EN80_ARGBR|nr:hypothetical protein HNY73_014117 [Argiope bruennichi]